MFVTPDFAELKKAIAAADAFDVQQALAAERIGIKGLAALLSPAAKPYMGVMAEKSAQITGRRFGRAVQLYAPLYLSSFCSNRCVYCGFSADNQIERRVLTLAEAEHEATILHDRGFNHLLLVSGEAPAKMGVAYLEELALRLRDRFAAISIEVQPLRGEEYARLFAAGITAVAVYQETYDRDVYRQVHLSGKKSDYDHRLATPALVAAAGMREVGIGALLGLSDWRAEGLAIGLHLAWLRKHFWRTALTVSFPRMRPAMGEFTPPLPVSEREMTQLIFALRIFDPDVGLLLSTREEARYRDGMLGLGPTRYSAGSCTVPGGYGNRDVTGEQFSVGDHRNIDEVSEVIRQKGFDPVRKDWDPIFQMHGRRPQSAALVI
ncbi:MAG: 2-iminoacetate synthase ThiH [Desulfobulbaceae bacterium]|nr:2-iminoacetate synthase ThiH [Desulfobulbaceae bacterium]HIJ78506.1 2-iminoacetate synthase ThiH [Deltaproteobacteria bacterium]